MLTIRKDQLDALGASAEDAFLDRLVTWTRDTLAIWVEHLSDDGLRRRVAHGIARARSHGFAFQSSIATFVALMLRFAPDFDLYPPVRAILDEVGADREGRAERLMREVTGAQWESVERAYDPAAWDEDFEESAP